MKTSILLAATLSLGLAAPALARGTAVVTAGDYSVDCQQKGKQCWWTIERAGKTAEATKYRATFYVADAMDHTKVSCKLKAEGFGLGTNGSAEVAMETVGKKPVPFVFQGDDDGGITAFATSAVEVSCKGANPMNGLSPIGD